MSAAEDRGFHSRFRDGLGLLLILVVAAGLRVQHIRADPPALVASVSGSAGIYFDEGIYCHNARNRVLYGRWITDEWNPLVYNAPLTLLYFLAFKLFGVSIVTVKGLSILFGLCGIAFFFAGLRALLARGPALALTALFALDFYGTMYNRIGLLENFSTLCFLAGFWLFVRSPGRPKAAFALGATAAVAALSKYLFAFYFLAAALAAAYRWARDADRKGALAFLAGGFAVGLPWFVGIYLPFRPTFGKIGAGWGMLSLPRSLGQALSNLVHNPLPRYLQLAPLAGLFLVLFGGLVLLRLAWARKAPPEPEVAFVFLWIAGGVLTMGLLNYRPLRYYVPLLPALYLAGGLLLRNRDLVRSRALRYGILALVPAGMLFPFFRMMAVRPSAFFVFPPFLRILIWAGLAAAISVLVMKASRSVRLLERGLPVLLLVAPLYLYVGHFLKGPTYDLERASRYMATLPPDSIVMGQEAPRLTLGTPIRALMAYENWFNDRDPFGRFRPTHLIVLDRFGGAELGWMRRRYPETVTRLEVLRTFRIWDTTMTLYRVPR